jgi:hypothetical protein
MARVLLILSIVLICGNCKTIKPYEKEYLLHPLMDEATTSALLPQTMSSQFSNYEKLSSSLSGGGGGSSCPTCGG